MWYKNKEKQNPEHPIQLNGYTWYDNNVSQEPQYARFRRALTCSPIV